MWHGIHVYISMCSLEEVPFIVKAEIVPSIVIKYWKILIPSGYINCNRISWVRTKLMNAATIHTLTPIADTHQLSPTYFGRAALASKVLLVEQIVT